MRTRFVVPLAALGLIACSSSSSRTMATSGHSTNPANAMSQRDAAAVASSAGADSGSGGAIGDGAVLLGDASTGENTTTACSVPTLPGIGSLVVDQTLPDPFMSMDGTRITTKDQWTCRRAEIMAQAEQYELGPKPPRPSVVGGSFASMVNDAGQPGGVLTVTASEGGKSISFDATVVYPATGTPPYPAMIGIDDVLIGPAQLQQMGVALIEFPASVVAQQDNAQSRGLGTFYDLYGSSATTGAMMAWAWGVSRLIDALEMTPSAQIDPKRVGVTGCSRDGKGALVVGAFDERISLTIPQESGAGGAGGWRLADYQSQQGTMVQTLSEITGENVWFETSFAQFNNSATRLPYDHHMLEGLVAPRALLVIENTSQVWLGNYSTYNDSMAANLIWQALGIPDHMGVSQVGDHAHCVWNGSQQPEVTAYVQKFLVGGGTADTNVLKTDAATYCPSSGTCTAYGFDQSKWVNWTVPTLN